MHGVILMECDPYELFMLRRRTYNRRFLRNKGCNAPVVPVYSREQDTMLRNHQVPLSRGLAAECPCLEGCPSLRCGGQSPVPSLGSDCYGNTCQLGWCLRITCENDCPAVICEII